MRRTEGREAAAGGEPGGGGPGVRDFGAGHLIGADLPTADLAVERDALRRQVAALREEMASRAVFDLACGIVMAMGRCSGQDAGRALLEVARRTGVTRGAIARLLVEGIGGPAPSEPVRAALREVLERVSEARDGGRDGGRGDGRGDAMTGAEGRW
ncbi:ANTAR domain-containing protein [Streptomyces polygonati]|uniref:ANTAR domain-containing protein n=1 Tax=Streptomyces polygonati TaxID=1617087 RepID=A0ABV8HSU9_9ACTN